MLEAGTEITIKAGGSVVKIDPAGVHLIGSVINLNSGGSAGSGSGYAGKTAVLPMGKEVEQAGSLPMKAPQNALENAQKLNAIAVKPCGGE